MARMALIQESETQFRVTTAQEAQKQYEYSGRQHKYFQVKSNGKLVGDKEWKGLEGTVFTITAIKNFGWTLLKCNFCGRRKKGITSAYFTTGM